MVGGQAQKKQYADEQEKDSDEFMFFCIHFTRHTSFRTPENNEWIPIKTGRS
jgi:hypothetical protein